MLIQATKNRRQVAEFRMQTAFAALRRGEWTQILGPGKAAQSHLEANAEGRMKNAESPGEATSCDINATSKPPQCVLIARR
jgi:hypothetical protein